MNLPTSPNEMNNCFAEAYNSGDIANLTALFEEGAQSVTATGTTLSGLETIKKDLEKLLLLGGKMTSNNRYAVQHGNIALLRADWNIRSTDQTGKAIEIKSSSTEVVRLQPDGTWLYIIDHPFGASAEL